MWAHCFQSFACEPDALYPVEFQQAAIAILTRDLGITEDEIKLENVQLVYLHLINEMS